MSFKTEWRRGLVYCKFSGEVSGEDLIGCIMSIYGHPSFDEIKAQVFDMSEVSKVTFTLDDMREMAAYDRTAATMNPRIKFALVATDQTALEMSLLYEHEMSKAPWEGRAFRTLGKALEWVSQ